MAVYAVIKSMCRRVFEILLGWLNVSAIFKAKEVDQTVVADGDPTGSGVYKDHVPNVLGTEVNLPQRPMKFPTLCSDPQWVQQKMNDVGDIKDQLLKRNSLENALRENCKSVIEKIANDPDNVVDQLYQSYCFSDEEKSLTCNMKCNTHMARNIFITMLSKDLKSLWEFVRTLGLNFVDVQERVMNTYMQFVSDGRRSAEKCMHCMLKERVSPTLVLDEFLSRDTNWKETYRIVVRNEFENRFNWEHIFRKAKEISSPDEIADVLTFALEQYGFHSDIVTLIKMCKSGTDTILECTCQHFSNQGKEAREAKRQTFKSQGCQTSTDISSEMQLVNIETSDRSNRRMSKYQITDSNDSSQDRNESCSSPKMHELKYVEECEQPDDIDSGTCYPRQRINQENGSRTLEDCRQRNSGENIPGQRMESLKYFEDSRDSGVFTSNLAKEDDETLRKSVVNQRHTDVSETDKEEESGTPSLCETSV